MHCDSKVYILRYKQLFVFSGIKKFLTLKGISVDTRIRIFFEATQRHWPSQSREQTWINSNYLSHSSILLRPYDECGKLKAFVVLALIVISTGLYLECSKAISALDERLKIDNLSRSLIEFTQMFQFSEVLNSHFVQF